MICTTCGRDNPSHLTFCQECGQRLAPRVAPPTPPIGLSPPAHSIISDLFPHERLGVQYYAVVVDSLDKQAGIDASIRQLLVQGVAQLDAAHNMPWVDLSDGARDAVLRGIEKTEFFTTVRTKTIGGLYGNPVVYQMFGYGGPSVQLGGYIDRGFDDIGWLPNA